MEIILIIILIAPIIILGSIDNILMLITIIKITVKEVKLIKNKNKE